MSKAVDTFKRDKIIEGLQKVLIKDEINLVFNLVIFRKFRTMCETRKQTR